MKRRIDENLVQCCKCLVCLQEDEECDCNEDDEDDEEYEEDEDFDEIEEDEDEIEVDEDEEEDEDEANAKPFGNEAYPLADDFDNGKIFSFYEMCPYAPMPARSLG